MRYRKALGVVVTAAAVGGVKCAPIFEEDIGTYSRDGLQFISRLNGTEYQVVQMNWTAPAYAGGPNISVSGTMQEVHQRLSKELEGKYDPEVFFGVNVTQQLIDIEYPGDEKALAFAEENLKTPRLQKRGYQRYECKRLPSRGANRGVHHRFAWVAATQLRTFGNVFIFAPTPKVCVQVSCHKGAAVMLCNDNKWDGPVRIFAESAGRIATESWEVMYNDKFRIKPTPSNWYVLYGYTTWCDRKEPSWVPDYYRVDSMWSDTNEWSIELRASNTCLP